MAENVNGNGESGGEKFVLDRIVLTYDRARDHLEIGAKCNSLDLMLDMLARATRTLEAQLRGEQAMALQQKMRDAARTQAIVDSVRGGR